MSIVTDEFKRRLLKNPAAKLAVRKLVEAGFPEEQLIESVHEAVLIVRRRGDPPGVIQDHAAFQPTKKDVTQAKVLSEKSKTLAEKLCGTFYYEQAKEAALLLEDVAREIKKWHELISWPVEKKLSRRPVVGPLYYPRRQKLIEEAKRLTGKLSFDNLAAVLAAAHSIEGTEDSVPTPESLKMEFYRNVMRSSS